MKLGKIYLHPGYVKSKDGDVHFTSARQLCECYRIDCRKYEVVFISFNRAKYEHYYCREGEIDLHLYPKPDGNYNLKLELEKLNETYRKPDRGSFKYLQRTRR